MKLSSTLRVLALASTLGIVFPAAQAQDAWPSKPITFVIPYAAGGFADTRMRLIARELADELGATIVVENKAGAGGVIGTAHIAKAKPDGYTIGSGHLAPLAVNPTLVPKTVSYNVKTDLTPIVLVEEAPLILNVNNSLPVKTVRDLIELAKKDPDSITFGSSGVGGAHHLSGELFAHEAGVKMSHVPYKGGAPAATDLMAGHISMMFEMGYAAMPAIESGKVHPLAVTSAQRLALLPDVPTLAESGLPGFESYNWQGIIAPAGIPAEVVAKLNEATNRVLKKPEVVKAFDATGGQVGGGTPEDFAKFIDSETRKWAEVIKTANISAD
ncbi:Bug family tripartite tricarboxylate transporter substrate binding protein [Paracandidimonas soli]|uniref:Tripartite-type tricarboxylate transporter receptor subunit TctC n=1 Tax=Paracandidimonas soli TaxID=1917182 RepID=A0A4R3V672_9BURK|nr:tripartite tricarboxylate transporter substrate binding protein [Paracandidimonas soli]TCU99092.1 tripartite-type tricarboxylate transporter receptor subunit TctC [Paracandidimonas soli]